LTDRTELENAIAVLEAQRTILGDAVVDAAVIPLRQQLVNIEHRRQEAGVSLAGERKLITILFADVVGSTALAERLGSETARLILYRCLRRFTEAVDEFGGTVSSLMGDGLMAFFGVPQTYENDPERAVMAAQRIHESIAGYAREIGQPLEVRVGINTGRTVVGEMGEMGGEVRSEHSSMGQPAVNMAARLQSAAKPGTTVLGESTARMVRYRFQVEPVEALRLKGFAEPVIAYELVGELTQQAPARGIPGLQSALVGRDRELEKLTEMTARLEAGIGGIAALIGEPGIGKSRLLQESKDAYQNGRLSFANGSAYSHTQDQPFSVILDLLAELLDLAADDSRAIMDLKLEAALSPLFEGGLETVWPFLASLLGAPIPPQYADALNGLDPEALNARMIQAVQMLVQKMAARHPLVLSFEDLQWADGVSLKLIESLLLDTEHYPVLILLLFRSDLDKPVWQLKLIAETHFSHRYLELKLTPLDNNASIEMIKNLLQGVNFPAELRETIDEKAQGNPLYVEELIRSLIEDEMLVRDGDSWELCRPASELDVPVSLEKVILARFDRLLPTERATLQAASVIGRRFAYRVLTEMIPTNGSLRGQLVRLQQAGMIQERSRIPELEYIFKHIIVQEVTYGTLITEQRRWFHREAAETLETLFPGRREELAGTLAQHYAAAGESSKAIGLFVQAAERAEEVYAYEEALHYLRRATALSDTEDTTPEEQLVLLERLADVHYLVRESPEAFQLYRESLDLIHGVVDADIWTAVRLHRKICAAWYISPLEDQRRLENQARVCLKAGLSFTDGQAPHLETVRLLVRASFCMHDWFKPAPELETADYYAQAAVEMAEQLDAPVDLSAALDALGSNYNSLGRLRDYLLVEQRRQRLSRDPRFNNLREKLNILNETANAMKLVGDFAQAIPLLLEAEKLAEEIQDFYNEAQALIFLSECWVRLDRWDEVLLVQEKIDVLQRRYPVKRLGGICWGLAFSASVHALRGHKEEAAQLADESYKIMIFFEGGNEETWRQKAPFY
jgi:class 3 adenylate cyclase/tetratricopeptide (TPR) repeat protein